MKAKLERLLNGYIFTLKYLMKKSRFLFWKLFWRSRIVEKKEKKGIEIFSK